MENKNASPNGISAKLSPDNAEKVTVNPGRLLRVVFSRWYWVAISMLFFLAIGYLYARSTQQEFLTDAVIRYDDKSDDSKFSTATLLPTGDGGSADYMAEVYTVKSSAVIYKALDSLNTHFVFSHREGLRNVNVYPHRPFELDVLNYDIDHYQGGEFTLKKNGAGYDIRYTNKRLKADTTYKNVRQGTIIKVPGLTFSLSGQVLTSYDKLKFTYIDYWAVKELSETVNIKEADRNMPVLRATFTSDNMFFSKDFLNALIATYSGHDLEAKKQSSEQTLSFINDQLNAFEGLMKKSSSRLENIKQRYDLLDVGATSNQYMSSVSALRERKLQLEIQGRNFDLVTDAIKNNKDVVANVVGWDGAVDPLLSNMLERLNTLNASRRQNSINYSQESIVIKNIDEEISGLKYKIIENIKLQKLKSKQAYDAYDKQLAELTQDLSQMPSAERDLVYTTSDVEVNKNIYTLLLNKKLETSIEKAAQTPTFSVIETARVAVQTAPHEMIIMAFSVLLGFVLGVVAIFMKRIFNNKFTNINGLVKNNVPILGIVNHHPGLTEVSESALKDLYSGRNVFTESVNAVRTNLLYKVSGADNLIAVTSEISGEGKSFIAANIAVALARVGKTVILVAADLRRSKLHKYFNHTNETGLSSYLSNDDVNLKSVVAKSSIEGLSYMPSGPVPANPSELLYKERFWSMLAELKRTYDYVILDTAPVGMVSDSMPILRKADLNIFVLRWLYSDKEAYNIPVVLSHDMNLNNMSVVVNDFRKDNLYGGLDNAEGNYGKFYTSYASYYGNEIENRPLWKRIFKTKSSSF